MPATSERAQHTSDVLDLLLERDGHRRGRELQTDSRGSFERFALRGVKVVDVPRNHFAERPRQRASDGLERSLPPPSRSLLDDEPAAHEAVDGVHHHEGIAASRVVYGGRQFRQALGTKSRVDVAHHVLEGQATERKRRRRGAFAAAAVSRSRAFWPAVHSPSQHVPTISSFEGI